MTQALATDVGHIRMPAKMLRAYKHSTNEQRALFNAAYERLIAAGLSLYRTNCPDLRARHPQNDIVFVILGFQEVAGTRIEVRVDSCPTVYYRQETIQPQRIKQYDANSKARWAVYRILCQSDLDAAMNVVCRLKKTRPAWGNLVANPPQADGAPSVLETANDESK